MLQCKYGTLVNRRLQKPWEYSLHSVVRRVMGLNWATLTLTLRCDFTQFSPSLSVTRDPVFGNFKFFLQSRNFQVPLMSMQKSHIPGIHLLLLHEKKPSTIVKSVIETLIFLALIILGQTELNHVCFATATLPLYLLCHTLFGFYKIFWRFIFFSMLSLVCGLLDFMTYQHLCYLMSKYVLIWENIFFLLYSSLLASTGQIYS